jgi:hypothetical protein
LFVLASLLAVSLRGRSACGFAGYRLHLGHPWPDFSRSFAIIPDGGVMSRSCAKELFGPRGTTSAIHGLTFHNSRFDWGVVCERRSAEST